MAARSPATQRSFSKSRLTATLILLIPVLLQVFPLLYVLSLSFKSKSETFVYPPNLIPAHFDFSNYFQALEIAPLGRFLLNSLIAAS